MNIGVIVIEPTILVVQYEEKCRGFVPKGGKVQLKEGEQIMNIKLLNHTP